MLLKLQIPSTLLTSYGPTCAAGYIVQFTCAIEPISGALYTLHTKITQTVYSWALSLWECLAYRLFVYITELGGRCSLYCTTSPPPPMLPIMSKT